MESNGVPKLLQPSKKNVLIKSVIKYTDMAEQIAIRDKFQPHIIFLYRVLNHI